MTPSRAVLYDLLAGLLRYPGPGYRARLARCRDALAEAGFPAAGRIAAFVEQTGDLTDEQLEELFTRTFDLNPVCSLEVGWHLFGQRYERGSFLVWMRGRMRRFGVIETTELPDHLTHVLALLGRMEQPEADEFAARQVLPALQRMLAGFEGRCEPYEAVLRAIHETVRTEHQPTEPCRRPAAEPHVACSYRGCAHD